MQLLFFAIPALDPGLAQTELNAALATHRIVLLERQFVAAGNASYWSVCVGIAEGPGSLPTGLKAGGGRKVDYRELLNDANFAVYSRLRALRKQLAESEGVPPYAVFTNEQLAALVQRRVGSLEELGTIDGIGPARIERYGTAFVEVLRNVSGVPSEPSP